MRVKRQFQFDRERKREIEKSNLMKMKHDCVAHSQQPLFMLILIFRWSKSYLNYFYFNHGIKLLIKLQKYTKLNFSKSKIVQKIIKFLVQCHCERSENMNLYMCVRAFSSLRTNVALSLRIVCKWESRIALSYERSQPRTLFIAIEKVEQGRQCAYNKQAENHLKITFFF